MKKSMWVLLIVPVLLWSGSLLAQPLARGVCAEDVKKFCKDTKPGGGAIVKCLKEHESDLSTACKEQMQRRPRAALRMQHLQSCKSDTEKFCKDVKPGGGAVIKCLKQHESELSDECKKSLPSRPGPGARGPRKQPAEAPAKKPEPTP